MLARHYDSVVSVASVLAVDIHCAMQWALASGCTPAQVCEQLDAERVKLTGSSFVPAVPIMSIGQDPVPCMSYNSRNNGTAMTIK